MQKKSSNLEFKISRNHILLAVLIPTMFVAMFLYSIITKIEVGEDYKVELIFAILVIIGTGVYVYNALIYKIIIDRETIKVKSLFTNTTLPLNMIGHHEINRSVILLYEKNNNEKPKIYIFDSLAGLDVFKHWLNQYSINIELEENVKKYNEELQEILKDKKYGKNTIEKEENLNNASKVVSVLTTVSLISMFWIVFASRGFFGIGGIEYVSAMFMAYPFVVIYIVYYFKGLVKVEFDTGNLSPHENIGHQTMIAGSISVYWMLSEKYTPEPLKIWIYGLVLSFFVTFLLFWFSQENLFKIFKDYKVFTGFWLIMLFHGYGTIAFLNAYGDTSKEQAFGVQILEKRESDGEKNKTYYFTLDAWEECATPEEIVVESYLYHSLNSKDFVRLHLKQGNLGIKWYTISE